jgi:hypothetical protein
MWDGRGIDIPQSKKVNFEIKNKGINIQPNKTIDDYLNSIKGLKDELNYTGIEKPFSTFGFKR